MAFDVILADPPYADQPDLDRLPIPPVASSSAALFVWAGPATKFKAFQLGAAWGFPYKTTVYWDRMDGSVAELLVFARPGSKLDVRKLPAMIRTPVPEDGGRPAEFQRMIQTVTDEFSSRRCLDVFATRKKPGWTPAGLDGDVRGDLRRLYEKGAGL